MARGWGLEGVGATGRAWRVAVWRGGERDVVVAAAAARVVVGRARRERRKVGRKYIVGGLEGRWRDRYGGEGVRVFEDVGLCVWSTVCLLSALSAFTGSSPSSEATTSCLHSGNCVCIRSSRPVQEYMTRGQLVCQSRRRVMQCELQDRQAIE